MKKEKEGKLTGYRSRSATVAPIAEKGLSSTRPAAKANSLEALLLCIELDKADPVIEDLLPSLSAKQPKVIAAVLAALTAIYHNYGCKIVDPKPVLKALPKVFGHADKNVRAESQNLTVELYRWLKEAIKPVFWNDLKPVQQQDLEKLFDKVKEEPAPKQERLTRGQQDKIASAPPAGGDEGDQEPDDEYDDGADDGEPLDLSEPVDVMPRIPNDLQEQLGSSKWKDRKEALDALYNAINVPRIQDGNFDEIARGLAKCMKDANVAVVTVAANCIDLLAKGLRSGFAKYRSAVMAPMMERLKEKKQSVSEALGQALDSVFDSTTLSDCLEETLGFLKHKNPQVKQETLKFLIRCLRSTRTVPAKPEIKSIAEAGTRLLTESSEVTRSGGAEILGTLMKILGERAMNPYLDGLDDIRKTKIKEYFETAQVRAKDRPKPIVGAPKAAAPPAKKTAPAGKRPAAKKAPPPAAAPPPPAPEEAPSPPKPKTLARPGIARPGGIPKPGLATPGSGLKMQRRIPGVGGAPAPQASPQRRSAASPPVEEPARAPAQPKLGLGRGLTGRPIGKPAAAAAADAAPPAAAPAVSGLGAVERAELEELRLERDRFTKMNEDLKSEKTKLTSQINEFQNQNAQLIEDHTRDVLSIKAKETQLVRARSDAETAEQTVQKQQREIERLKRELARAVRAAAISPPPVLSDGGASEGGGVAPLSPDAGAYNSNNSSARSGLHTGASRLDGAARPRSYVSSPSDDKENNNGNGLASPSQDDNTSNNNNNNNFGRRKFSPPASSGVSSRGSPSRPSARYASTGSNNGSDDQQQPRSAEPAENWKRAAEVTSQLKARIEQMKVSRLLSVTHFLLN